MGIIAPFAPKETIMFRPGNIIELFNVVGIRYGTVCGEANHQFLVTNLEQADSLLRSMLGHGLILPREYRADLAAMRRAGLCETETAFFRKFVDYRLPRKSFQPQYTFAQCACKFIPLTHGQVMYEGEAVREHITTLSRGMQLVMDLSVDKELPPFEGISLVKQMVALKLPMTPEDLEQRFKLLPVEVQLNFYHMQDIDDLLAEAKHPDPPPVTTDDDEEEHLPH